MKLVLELQCVNIVIPVEDIDKLVLVAGEVKSCVPPEAQSMSYSVGGLSFRTLHWLNAMTKSVGVDDSCPFVICDFHCDGGLYCFDSPITLPPRL